MGSNQYQSRGVGKGKGKRAVARKPKGQEIGSGSTGKVFRVGDRVEKSAILKDGSRSSEGAVYSEIGGLAGISPGKQVGDKIVTPFYKNIVSVDAIDANKRTSFGPIIAKQKTVVFEAVSTMSSHGIDYNDPLQFGFDSNRKAHLFDFSNAAKRSDIDVAFADNIGHAKSFFTQFGLPGEAKHLGITGDVFLGMRSHVRDKLDADWLEPVVQPHVAKLASQLDGRLPEVAYYARNARHVGINGVAQTEPIEGIKVVLSDVELTPEQVAMWELTPVLNAKKPKSKAKPVNLSIDAVPTLHINRTLNPNSSPTPPDIPNADELADETIGYLESVLAEIQDRLLAGQPFGDVSAKLDQLVAQAELSSWIAGAVGVWHDSRKPRLYTLDLLGQVPTKRFPWIEEAARWLMDRNVYSAQEIQAQARGEFEPRWKSLEAATKLRDEIANGFTVGESFEEFYARIKSKVDATKPELQNAFRTSTHQAYIHGTATTLEKPLVKLQFPFVLYRSAHDTRTRDTHRPLDGLLFEVGSPAYTIMRRALNDFNCILPDQIVEGCFSAAVKSFYRGQAVEIKTKSGAVLRVTMNHPVLTENGWVNAGTLKQGDKLFRHMREREVIHEPAAFLDCGVRTSQVNDAPTTVEQVFRSLAASGRVEMHLRKTSDLHGEGEFVDADIEVVRTNGLLLRDRESVATDHVRDFILESSVQSGVNRLHVETTRRADALRPFKGLSIGSTSGFDTRFIQAANDCRAINAETFSDLIDGLPVIESSNNNRGVDRDSQAARFNAELLEPDANGAFCASLLLADSLSGESAFVEIDEVSSVLRFDFSGHVYDLQSITGLIIADSIVISNCRCGLTSQTEADAQKKKLRPVQVDDLPAEVLAKYGR